MSESIPASLPLRNDLIGEEPYGAPQLDVPVCLNVNENPYAPDPAVCDSIAARVRQIAPTLNRYPDREHIELRQAFATYLKRESGVDLSVDQLWGANGSNEIMLQVFQAFGGPGRTALGCDPTYSMYPEYARDTFTADQLWGANGSNEIMLQVFQAFGGPGRTALGCDPTYSMYPEYARDTFTAWRVAHRNEDFTLNVERTIAAINEVHPAIVLLTSPNNPTGTPLDMADLNRILDACQSAPVAGAGEGVHPIVVVDEAYIEFRNPGTPSAVTLIAEHPNLAVSRTMSKAFAFAGARVGYMAASKGIIDCLRIVRMPYHLSAITQAAALAAFEHTDEQLSRVDHLRDIRQQTAAWLTTQTYQGRPLEVAESESNFLLFGGHFADRDRIFRELLDRGVLIRVVGPEGWLRVCMGTDEEMARFRTALAEVLAEPRDAD